MLPSTLSSMRQIYPKSNRDKVKFLIKIRIDNACVSAMERFIQDDSKQNSMIIYSSLEAILCLTRLLPSISSPYFFFHLEPPKKDSVTFCITGIRGCIKDIDLSWNLEVRKIEGRLFSWGLIAASHFI